MGCMIVSKNLKKSNPVRSRTDNQVPFPIVSAACANPPHQLMETLSSYSIFFNLLGIDQKDIGVDINEQKREVAVLARKGGSYMKQGFYWVFGIPSVAALNAISIRYRSGVLEIIIPKQSERSAA